ncbi:MAG TPA: RluA family pseudouridine synthase [Patescibacteria group bacterium]|nr:RluA family pseudouridine synthase [Patescibacteria group bacterium]
MEKVTVKADETDKGARLDKVLARHAPEFSRSRLQQLIEQGNVLRGGAAFADSSHKVKPGEEFTIVVPPAVEAAPVAQKIAIDIVYEDKDMLVINKAPDMVVHPGAGNWDGTLVNALLAHCGDQLSGIGGVRRPGIVHRLDKETSGLLVVAKNDAAHKGLSAQLESRKLKRVYNALCWGNVTPTSGRIETQIGRSRANRQKMGVMEEGGKDAVTDYRLLQPYGLVASLVECRLQTGRTHQIRVHMAHINHWIIGDPVYGKGSIPRFLKNHKVPEKTAQALQEFPRQALHAAEIQFNHPLTNDKLSFKAGLPDDMQRLIKQLQKL